MKPEAERRRWRHQVVSGGGIPLDVIALILSHMPLKSMGRFKAVSRSWCQLIQSLNLPPFFLGFFHTILSRIVTSKSLLRSLSSPRESILRYIVGGTANGKGIGIVIDPVLSFLPVSDLKVVDCRNGLLLLCRPKVCSITYYICNPLTKSWTQLYGLDPEYSRLDFDPNVSPYFKVVSFPFEDSVLKVSVLSSDAMTWKHYAPVKFPDLIDYKLASRSQHHALWEGSLYLLFGTNFMDFGDAGRIMRVDLLEDRAAYPQLIEFPKGTKKPIIVGIGRSRNKLCLAGIDWITNNNNNTMVPKLRVWSLSKKDQTVWVLEHDNIITSSHRLCPPPRRGWTETTYIGQFHPLLDVIFILSKNMVYAYDLKNLLLDEVGHMDSNVLGEVLAASIFPFFLSPVDYSTHWKTTSEGEQLHIVKA